MATFIDATLLEGLRPIFVFLLIFAMVYALLTMTKVLGENKSMHAIIAVVIGLLMIISGRVVDAILLMIPWFVLIAIFLVLVIMVFKALGSTDEGIRDALKERSYIGMMLGIIAVVIVLGSIASVFGQQELDVTKKNTSQITFRGDDYQGSNYSSDSLRTDTDDFSVNARNTIYHPRMLGFIVIMIIGLFTVALITKPT